MSLRDRSGTSVGRRGRRRPTRIEADPEEEAKRRDAELRAKVRLKLSMGEAAADPEEPAAPAVHGTGSSEEVRKALGERRNKERASFTQRLQRERKIAQEARAKVHEKPAELIKDLPEDDVVELADDDVEVVEEEGDEVEVVESEGEKEAEPKEAKKEKLAEGEEGPPRIAKTSTRLARRSVILKKADDPEGKGGSQRTAPAEDAAVAGGSARTRPAFMILGVVLMLFVALVIYRWIATGKAPSDLVTVEGQADLGQWAMDDLGALLGEDAPKSEEDTLRLVEESQEQVTEKTEQTEKKVASAPAPAKPAKPAEYKAPASPWDKPHDPKASSNTKPSSKPKAKVLVRRPKSDRGGRSAEPLEHVFTERDPRLAAARQAYEEANRWYAASDPRSNDFHTVQKNIRLAIPHLQRCMDECTKLRDRGVKSDELEVLEQSAAMRLYDCNKRMTLAPVK